MLLALALFALAVPSGFAQVSRTTGALTGTVTDDTGAPLPGVSVTVSSPQLQGTRTELTDAKGEYSLPVLPPGTYKAEFSLAGIPTVTRDNITVSLNQTTKLNVPMKLAVSETVTVTASQVVVDPTQVASQQNFKEDHLKYAVVGSGNRSYQNVLQQAAGVAGGSNPQVSGANNAQNTWMLDGINTTDPVTHTFGNNLAFDAIQEISIQTLGKDAEYGSSGGTVNVITKSGGNNFSGTFDARYNDTHLQEQGKATHPTGISFFGATPTGSALNFNKNTRPTSSKLPALTVGGPILRDKLWFFTAIARSDTATTAPNVFGFQPGTRTFKGWNNLAKITFTPVANQTLTAKFIDSYAAVNFANNSSFVSPEADAVQGQGSRTYGVTYDAILNSKWLANVQLGHTPARLSVTPYNLNGASVVDENTGIQTGAYSNFQARTSKRDELEANTTYYMERFGTHAAKIGLDLNHTDFSSFNNANGNPALIAGYNPSFCSPTYGFPSGANCAGVLELFGGVDAISLSVINPAHTVNSKEYAFFAQDEWNPITRLTVRYGVRYEQVKWDSQSVTSPPDFKMWQPRIGAAYDIFNNSRSVVHGYAGKIMDDNQLTLPSFGVALPTGSALFVGAPGGPYAYDAPDSAIFLSGEVYDPKLKPSYSNQFSLGFTQKFWRNTSVDVTGEVRKQKDLFEDYCGSLQNGFLASCVITNHPGFDVGATEKPRADYHGLVTKVESRPYQWLDLLASWTHARSRGTVDGEATQNASADFDIYPVHFQNYYGYLSDDARNRIKLDGYVHLPLDFTVGANYYWDDGTPYSVFQTASTTSATGVVLPYGTYFIEPRGSRRLPNFSQLDLQVQKDFRISNMKLGIIGSVFNVFNDETAAAINGNAGSRAIVDPATGMLLISGNQQTGINRIASGFGQPTAWQRPRRYEVGLRLEF
jgi:hypothetical protein